MSCDCISHVGEARFDFNPGFRRVEWVEPGMRVIAQHSTPELPNGGVWCVVLVAAGHHARIWNEKRGIDRWVHISTLCVPDPVSKETP